MMKIIRHQSKLKHYLLILLFLVSIAIPLFVPQVSVSTPIVQIQENTTSLVERAQKKYYAKQYQEAAILWQQAVDAFTRQEDQLNQAMALSNLSLTYQKLGQWKEAKSAIAQSLSLLQSLESNSSQQRILAQTLDIEGQLQLSLSQPTNALETWQKATNIYEKLGDNEKVSQSQINQAQAMQALGFYPRACRTLLETLNLNSQECQINPEDLQKLPEKPSISLQILGLRSLGNVLRVTGQTQKSVQVLLKSAELAQKNSNSQELGKIALSLGNTNRVLGNQKNLSRKELTSIDLNSSISCLVSENLSTQAEFYQKAIACYRQAEQSPSSLTKVQAQLNLLSLLIQLQQFSEVPPLINQIESELSQLSPNHQTVTANLKLAQNLMCLRSQEIDDPNQLISPILQSCPINSLNSLEKEKLILPTWPDIQQQIKIALNQATELGDKPAQANALGYLGATYQEIGEFNQGQQLTELALQQISAYDNPELAYFWQWQLARLYSLQGKNESALAAYTVAVEILQSLRGDLVTSSADIQFSFRDSVEPVYRELVDKLLTVSANQTEREKEKKLQKARDVIESLQLAELNNFFREACLEAESQEIDQIDPEAAVIYPIILPQRLAIILSLPKKPLSYYEIPFNRDLDGITLEKIEQAFDDFLANLNPFIVSQNPLKPHQQFYNWLIRPLEAQLEANDIKTLVFVLDGLLRNIPMAALHDGQQYLIEKYSIAIAPGLQLIDPRSLARESFQALAGGLAAERPGFKALPGVKEEINEISEIVPSSILLDQDFTSERFEQEIGQTSFPIVHLATHGQFSSQAEDTFLLTWDERINVKNLDQLLRQRENQQRNPIELLILSACQTATGDKRAVLGLAGTALRSGARSTIATLWSVQDQSTADLITQFYQQLNQPNMSKAEALRKAQLSLLKDSPYQHPFYWSPFVLVGNWQ